MMYFSQAEPRARRIKDLSSTKGVHRRNRGSDNSRGATDRRTSTNDRAIFLPKTKHTSTHTYTRNTGPPDIHYTATITWTDIQSQLAQKTHTPDKKHKTHKQRNNNKRKKKKKRKRDYPFTTRQNHKDKIVLMYPRRDKSRIRPGTAEVDTTPRLTSTQFASYRIEFTRFLAS